MLVGSVCAQAHELWGGTVTFPAGRLTSRLAGVLVVGVFGLVASYSLLFEDLMSKLMGLLIVGVLRPSAFRPLRVGDLMSQLMGFLLGRPLPTPLKTMGGVLAVCDGRR